MTHQDPPKPAGGRDHWPELDLSRGLAAVLMVANHVALPPAPGADFGPLGAVVFLGSFAPVLFFFATGLGHGVQSTHRPPGRFSRTLIKCAILYAADTFLWIRPGSPVGLDFLAFIALSLLLVDGLRRLRSGTSLALILAATGVLVRYVVEPLLHRPSLESSPWWLTGVASVVSAVSWVHPGFSYALCPWIVYPLLGYAAGRLAGRQHPWLERNRTRVALLALLPTLGFAGAAGLLVARGMVLFRWGPMSASYFVASVAFLCASLALSLRFARASWTPWIAMSGERSFAVVPLHFFLRGAFSSTIGPAVTPASYARNLVLVLVLSITGSSLIPVASGSMKRSTPRRLALLKLAIIAMASGLFLVLALLTLPFVADLAARCLAQLMLCLLLALPAKPGVARPPASGASFAMSGAAEPSPRGM